MLAVLPKSRSMPTHDTEGQFPADFQRITEDQRTQFMAAVYHMVDDLRARRPLRNSLRVRALQGHAGIFDLSWDMPDGRATFRIDVPKSPGDTHIIWRRVGGHEVFKRP